MPRNSCDVCCQPGQLARDNESYKAAHLQILCGIITAIEQGEGAATVYPQGTAAAADDDGTAVLFVRRDTAAAVADNGDFVFPSANSFGAQRVDVNYAFQSVPATSILKLEDSASASGDAGVFALGIMNENAEVIGGGQRDYTGFAVNSVGAIYVDISRSHQGSAASILKVEDNAASDGASGTNVFGVRNSALVARTDTDGDYGHFALADSGALAVGLVPFGTTAGQQALGAVRLEDTAHVSGDPGVVVLGIRNGIGSTFTNAEGDYSGIAVNPKGSVYVNVDFYNQYEQFGSPTGGLLKREDDPAASADAGVFTLLVRQDTIASSNADGDYGAFKSDSVGALYTTPGTQAAVWNFGVVASGSIVTASFVEIITNALRGKLLMIDNGTDVTIDISFDNSNVAFRIYAGQSKVIDLAANGRHQATNVYARAVSLNASNGSVQMSMMI